MNLIAKKTMLTKDHKLDPDDFYVVKEKFGEKIIIRRTGIDKLESQARAGFSIESIIATPYGSKINVIVYASARDRHGECVKALASANPDNCSYPQYAETAEKRCKHKLILKILRLYEHDIYSEVESEEWSESRNNYQGAVKQVEQKLNEAKNGQK